MIELWKRPGEIMPATTTFRLKGGGARVSVNLDAETLQALHYLTEIRGTEKEAINQAIKAAARESWNAEHGTNTQGEGPAGDS
jgi:hypothetical protein